MAAVRCPECGLETSDSLCPKCGSPVREPDVVVRSPTQPAITFTVTSKPPPDQVASDWRAELRKKLRQHNQKKGLPVGSGPNQPPPEIRTTPRAPEVKTKPPAQEPETRQQEESAPSIFEYRLKDESALRQEPEKVVPIKPAVDPKPLVKPIHKPAPRPQGEGDGRQARLRLETPARPRRPPRPQTREAKSGPARPVVPATVLSSEILFTRVLSWLIDVICCAAIGGVFGFAAAKLVGEDFLTTQWLQLSITCAISLYLLSTVFFLYATRQTPGMIWTDLILESEEAGKTPDLIAVLIRTLLFPVSAATVVGLLWSIFDTRKRCWHDYLSSTWVGPVLPNR